MANRRPRDLERLTLLAAERSRIQLAQHGTLRVGVGYPGPYRVAHSSLAFQWVVELAGQVPGVGVERFCADPGLAGATLEAGTPLGDLDLLAFSCSFEPEAVELLRVLDAAGIPRKRTERGPRHPLVVVGGALAVLNPLPLAPAVDLFCLGAAELLWSQLLELVRDGRDRERLLADLAGRPGFLVPEHHLDAAGAPRSRLRQLQRHDIESAGRDAIPASHRVTPHTEYRDRALVELSRGCPERCRYCWVSHNEGRFAGYPTAALVARVDQLASLSPRVGLVATAVGDHPGLPDLLDHCLATGVEVAVSSLRITAMVPEVLRPLVACGARSTTIAPETGSDRLRRRLGKPVTNGEILAAVACAAACGISSLKMYFIVGLPDETDDDLTAVARLVADARAALVAASRAHGRLGEVRVTVNPLVPKPCTPFHREAMLPSGEYRRRFGLIARQVGRVANVRLAAASYREALWQGYLARATVASFPLLEEAAGGAPLAELLKRHRTEVEEVTRGKNSSPPAWRPVARMPRPAGSESSSVS
jgi:radical SAM superfamily enzyme YgiQ (UPF0313 family)